MAKEKGAKKKKDQDKPKTPRIYVSRRSKGSTVKRIEARQQTHRHRVERKEARLERRCADLIKLLGSQGEDYYTTRKEMPIGKVHNHLRRMARRRGIIGPPLKRRKSRAEKIQSMEETHMKEMDDEAQIDREREIIHGDGS